MEFDFDNKIKIGTIAKSAAPYVTNLINSRRDEIINKLADMNSDPAKLQIEAYFLKFLENELNKDIRHGEDAARQKERLNDRK